MTPTFKNSGIIYVFQKRPFLTPPYFDSISGNSFLQIIANPKYPTRCAWQAPSIMTGLWGALGASHEGLEGGVEGVLHGGGGCVRAWYMGEWRAWSRNGGYGAKVKGVEGVEGVEPKSGKYWPSCLSPWRPCLRLLLRRHWELLRGFIGGCTRWDWYCWYDGP